MARSWATAGRSLSPGREAELGPGGLARAVDRSRPRPCLGSYVSDHRSGGAGGARACFSGSGYPKIPRAETAPGWTTWERCRSSGQTRRSGRSTPEVTRRHDDQSAFSMLPKEHPTGSLRWPLGSSRYAGTESSSVSRLTNKAPASEEAGCSRVAGATARPEAGDPRAGQVRPRSGPASRSQVLTGVSGAHRSGAADRRGQRTGRSDERSA